MSVPRIFLRQGKPSIKKIPLLSLTCFLWSLAAIPALALDSGDIAKDFALRDANGAIITFGSLLEKSELVVLEFFSVYCHTCRQNVPFVNTIAQHYTSRGVSVLGVALESTYKEVDAFVKQFDAHYPVLADPDKTTYYLYGIHKVPALYLIDNLGIIRYRGFPEQLKGFEELLESFLTARENVLQDGDIVPDFTLSDRTGKTVNLDTWSRNRNTILGFFFTDDEASRSQAQILGRIYSEYQGQDVTVLGIAAKEFSGTIDQFIKQCKIEFPFLIDSQGKIAENYKLSGTTRIFVINEEGRIRSKGPSLSYAALLEALGKEVSKPREQLSPEEKEGILKRILPQAGSYDTVQVNGETIYVRTTPDGKKQYARFVQKDTLCDVCSDVCFVYALDAAGVIRTIHLIESLEKYGTPIEGREFLQQFVGKSYHETLVPGKNVDVITGATKSSLKIIEGLNETEAVFKKYLADPAFDVAFRKEQCFKNQNEIEWCIRQYNEKHPQPMETLDLQSLTPYCANGTAPQCPGGGTYRMINFSNLHRVMCTVHGLDPLASHVY